MSADEDTVTPIKASEPGATRPSAPADETTELTAQDVVEKDTRSFFFRHVTAIVKFCGTFLIAGRQVVCIMCLQHYRSLQVFTGGGYAITHCT